MLYNVTVHTGGWEVIMCSVRAPFAKNMAIICAVNA